MNEELIIKISSEFDPGKPLPLNDRRYVECSLERGSDRLFERMANTVRRTKENTCQLLSGHRGCGKTTELYRLQRGLSFIEPRQFVVYCEATRYIHLNAVEYTDVLLMMTQQLWQNTQGKGIELNPDIFESIFAGVESLFKRLTLKGAEIEVGWEDFLKGKLSAEFKDNTDIRHQIRSYLRDHTPNFLEATNELIRLAKAQLKDSGYDGLTIIVDNLDRVPLDKIAGTNRDTHQALFLDAGGYLSSLDCDVIYTIPPTLYSRHASRLKDLYGSHPQMLPMIPIAKHSGDKDGSGIAKLVETIARRMHEAVPTRTKEFDAGQVIEHLCQTGVLDSQETVNRLCMASGGHLRRLMTLMSSICTDISDLPITREAVEYAIRQERDLFIHIVSEPKQRDILRKVAETKMITDDENTSMLLDNFAVLGYYDKDIGPWYDINPVIRETQQFKA
jgi:hypothetical protein